MNKSPLAFTLLNAGYNFLVIKNKPPKMNFTHPLLKSNLYKKYLPVFPKGYPNATS